MVNYENLVTQLLQPAHENQDLVHEYLKVLQPAIWRTVERQGTVLEKRYQSIFSALERAATNLHKYKDSLNKLKDSIEKSDSIQKTLVDVKNFKSYS